MSIEEFLNACEQSLRRAEAVVRQPMQLQIELTNLEELLRCEWPEAILKIKESGLAPDYKKIIDLIFERITKMEAIAQASNSLFDGLEDFMQRSNNR
jgi:hypothetical protein